MCELKKMTVLTALFAAQAFPVCAQNALREPPKQNSGPLTSVKSRTLIPGFYGAPYWGEVTKIDEKSIEIRCVGGNDLKKSQVRVFHPIDVLAKGDVLEQVGDGCAYRWQDIKKGDRVHVRVAKDEGVHYCYEICLERRPGGKIPESQKPSKTSVPYHVLANILNDITNGLDVSDDEIVKAFPFKKNPFGPDLGVKADSMPDDYHRKLDAIREKKAKDLKAKPADKK